MMNDNKVYKLEFTGEELRIIWDCATQVCKIGINAICKLDEDYSIPRKTLLLSYIYTKISNAYKEGD